MATLTAPGDARKDGEPHPASLDEPEVGARLGRYVIGERLGAGGMSQVYRADDPELRRPVAIKLMRGDLALSAAARERFAREGQAMARLTHPNVATVFDVGQHGGRFFLAIELLEGGTLADWLARPRGEREVMTMMRAAARGLAAAHACGIVHRDFKPENVLLTRDGTPRVSDFGLAASVSLSEARSAESKAGPPSDERITVAGAVMGTPAYMAPEQRAGRPADERADQYSLCLVWLEALGRERGTPAGSPGGARGAAAVVRTLMRGLDEDPARRWPSVAALLAALDARDRRRRRLLTGAAVLAALAAAVAGWRLTRAPRPTRSAADPARVLKRHKAGEGPWRMTLAGDGATVVRDNGERDALWLEHLDRSGSTPLALPPGRKVSRRMDALPGVSAHAETVLVRMEDMSLWALGGIAPVLLREQASGPACLHPSGDRAVTGAIREPIEIRATADGRALATGPVADLCTWLGDRLVLGMRLRATAQIRILELDGRVRDLAELPGDLGGLAVDARGRIIVAHHVRDGDGAGSGTLTVLSPDGAASPVTLRRGGAAGYQFLAATARGLLIAEVPTSSHLEVARLDPAQPAAPLALRSLDTGTTGDGSAVWLDGDRLAFSHDRGVAIQRASGPPDATTLPITGQPVGRIHDELLVFQRQSQGGADLQPRCVLAAVSLPDATAMRTVRTWPCAELGFLRCRDQGPCAVGLVDGDVVRMVGVDPRDGAQSPPLVTRPLGGTPHAAIGVDGRWLIESNGDLAIVDPTGVETPVATHGWPIEDATWSPGGAIYAASKSDVAFTVLHLAPERATVLATSPQSLLGPPVFNIAGDRAVLNASERLPAYLLLPL